MGIFFGSKEVNELVLVFDIGSSSVGGILFHTQESGIPKIIFSTTEPILLEKDFDINRFLFLTIKSLEVVAERIYKKGLGAPHKIFCILSSAWYVSQTRVIHLSKNTPFVFNEKFADGLVQKEVALLKNESLAQDMTVGNSLRTIELKNIKIMLNGYETESPLDQKGKELEMTIFVSMSGERILQKIEETIGRYFHGKEIKFSSFVMSSFVVVRDMYTQKDSFLLIDIGGEVTDISMVKKNIIRESTTFPLGHNYITREIANNLSYSLGEASSLLSLLRDGHEHGGETEKISKVLKKLRAEWLNKFQESLANLSNDISIPATIYMTVNKDFADFFTETIKIEQFSQYTLAESKFEVIFLSNQMLNKNSIFKDISTVSSDLIIDSIYINRLLIKI